MTDKLTTPRLWVSVFFRWRWRFGRDTWVNQRMWRFGPVRVWTARSNVFGLAQGQKT